jgi:hypothetical protein
MNIQRCLLLCKYLQYYIPEYIYAACSFLQNAVKIPVTTNLRLKAIDQDTGIGAEINYEMIRGM